MVRTAQNRTKYRTKKVGKFLARVGKFFVKFGKFYNIIGKRLSNLGSCIISQSLHNNILDTATNRHGMIGVFSSIFNSYKRRIMIKKNFALPGEHDYSDKNFDIDLYKASINVTDIEVMSVGGPAIFTANYEFLAQYADGQRWVKDVAIFTGEPGPELLNAFKKHLLESVDKARKELRGTQLNGKKAE